MITLWIPDTCMLSRKSTLKKTKQSKKKRCLSIDIVLKINVSKSMIGIISNVEGSKVSRLLVWVCIWIWMKPCWATFWPNYSIVMFVFSLVCKLRNNSSFLTHKVFYWMGKVLYASKSLYMIRSNCICGSLGSIVVTSNVNKSPTLLLKLRKSVWVLDERKFIWHLSVVNLKERSAIITLCYHMEICKVMFQYWSVGSKRDGILKIRRVGY